MASGKIASDFEKIINAGRDRKKNEALAAKIFNKDRRASAPLKATGAGASLASRAGVKKRVASSSIRPGNINGEWTHDLHASVSAPSTPQGTKGPKPNSLAARITDPNAPASKNPRQQRRAAQVAQALIRTELQPAAARQVNVVGAAAKPAFNKGLSIRGLAGPFVVMAQNFAPGTTAADIESAVTPVGGLVTSCRLLKTQPIVIAELVFESKEGGEAVIATFNNQTADGRVLHVYPKAGPAIPTQPRQPPTAPRAQQNGNIVDGTLGFEEPMETDSVPSNGNGGLYSDRMVQGGRRGRGFGRGGRGGRGGAR